MPTTCDAFKAYDAEAVKIAEQIKELEKLMANWVADLNAKEKLAADCRI